MSVVADFVLRLESQLDDLPWEYGPYVSLDDFRTSSEPAVAEAWAKANSPRVKHLLQVLKALSASESSQVVLSASRLRQLLVRSGIMRRPSGTTPAPPSQSSAHDPVELFVDEIEWLILRKATIQVHALVFQTLLDEVLPLEEHIGFWESVLLSSGNSILLYVQTFPGRVWELLRNVWARRNFGHVGMLRAIRYEWRWRSIADVRRRVGSPLQRVRALAKARRSTLKQVLEAKATVLGIFLYTAEERDEGRAKQAVEVHLWHHWAAARINVMERVLDNPCMQAQGLSEQLRQIWPTKGPRLASAEELDASTLVRRLIAIIDTGLPDYSSQAAAELAECRKPSVLVRYWLPAVVAVLSSSTILRFLFSRKTTIITWIKESGATVRDFWFNWVVEPVRHVVGTIRRDPTSEVVLLSKESLRAERESLERMVVDFVKDHPQYVEDGLGAVSETQLAAIRSKVSEGDITPVLRAYEHGLKKPFQRAVAGELVESLLIRVQKVEVVLEATIKGVDSLLEQQQLLFGIIGLAPGMLVVGGGFAYLRRVLSAPSARSLRNARQRAVARTRFMREATRLVTGAKEMRPEQRRGLLLVEIYRLRALIEAQMPGEVQEMLLEDLDELLYTEDMAQAVVLERIWKAYGSWLSRLH